ncbi:MAG: IMP dehydrogenase [Candidatus Sericytochromatia bacterium]
MLEAFNFNDVLLQPKFTDIKSKENIDIKTKLTKNISLNIPFISSNIETVTEANMAIALAEEGGIGIIHSFFSIEDQVKEIIKVKRAHNFIIQDPYTINLDSTVLEVIETMKIYNIESLIVVDDYKKLKGIVSQRDLLFQEDEIPLSQVMTPIEKLIYKKANSFSDVDFEEAKKIIMKNKLEKLPLIDDKGYITGLITAKDIKKRLDFSNAVKDENAKLRVGAAVEVNGDFFERSIELIKAGVDVLLLDSSYGHSQDLLDAILKIKSNAPKIDLIAGNISTKQGAIDVIKAGADAIKCGSSSYKKLSEIGVGVPQLTAIMDCCDVATYEDIPVITGDSIKYSGDIIKALAAGSSSIMLGELFNGYKESPKILENNINYSKDEYDKNTFSKGSIKNYIKYLVDNLKTGMIYLGVNCIEDIQKNAEFIKLSKTS